MSDSNFLKNIQTEIDASYLYQILSENEVDQQVAYIDLGL